MVLRGYVTYVAGSEVVFLCECKCIDLRFADRNVKKKITASKHVEFLLGFLTWIFEEEEK